MEIIKESANNYYLNQTETKQLTDFNNQKNFNKNWNCCWGNFIIFNNLLRNTKSDGQF